MIYEHSPQQIADKVVGLSKQKVEDLLKENDQMLLTWNRSELYKKWPKCLIPGKEGKVSSNSYFTGMMGNIKQKAYSYEAPIEATTSQVKQFSIKSFKIQVPGQEQQQFRIKEQHGDNRMQQVDQQQLQKVQEFLKNNSVKSDHIGLRQQFSPFLANCDNPFDRNANSKTLKQKFDKLRIDSGKRNIVAIVEQQKKNGEAKEMYRFGKSLPKKSTDSIDITDILKYTLGLKREKQQGVKPEPLKNPFVRVPQKYYESMGDFYKGGLPK